MNTSPVRSAIIGSTMLLFGVIFASVVLIHTVLAVNTTSSTAVVVGNAAPTVTAVTLTGPITLVASSTQTVNVTFQVTDNNGCSDVFTSGVVTTTLFRTSLTSACTANNLNCYVLTTTTNNCTSQTTANATATFSVFYFAQPTDASSSFPTDSWTANVQVRDGSASTSTASSATTTLQSLLAINVTPTSINYGTLGANTNTGATNQTTTVANVGNVSSTLQTAGQTVLTSGANTIPNSNQHFASTTFTFGGTEQSLSSTLATVTGFRLNPPTTTSAVASPVLWGLAIPLGQASGSYSGVNQFSAVFSST